MLAMSTMVRANEMELRIKHTSRTGILPPVSFTHRDEKLKMRDARNAHVKPEFQTRLQSTRCSGALSYKQGRAA